MTRASSSVRLSRFTDSAEIGRSSTQVKIASTILCKVVGLAVLVVALQSVPQVRIHVGRVVVIIISGAADIQVYANGLATIQADQGHVAVGYGKKGD